MNSHGFLRTVPNGKEMVICSDHNGIGPTTGYVDAAGSSPVSGSDCVVADIADLITTPVRLDPMST